MASLKELRKRISSVRSTQQITRAMKMIAASKLRRVQDKVKASRPFSGEVLSMIRPLFWGTKDVGMLSPFLRPPADGGDDEGPKGATKNIRVLMVTSDRGLCGAYNGNVCRRTLGLVRQQRDEGHRVVVDVVGKKGYRFLKRQDPESVGMLLDEVGKHFSRKVAVSTMAQYRQQFLAGEFDVLMVVFTEFVSTMSQRVGGSLILPIDPEMIVRDSNSNAESVSGDHDSTMFLIEPPAQQIAGRLVEAFLDSRFYQLLLDSVASEYGARMMAMENATRNASEMINSLTRVYNRQRQASITNEMIEIISGAEALV